MPDKWIVPLDLKKKLHRTARELRQKQTRAETLMILSRIDTTLDHIDSDNLSEEDKPEYS